MVLAVAVPDEPEPDVLDAVPLPPPPHAATTAIREAHTVHRMIFVSSIFLNFYSS
ncbi:hypothetical protein BURPSPAST_P0250 [Burkholderia pseudomallei Pasteur 52237]|nr:hypothetical protein BURPSPAST_P0250 [Burkholderia pseudomallei Pasteur 52237]